MFIENKKNNIIYFGVDQLKLILSKIGIAKITFYICMELT